MAQVVIVLKWVNKIVVGLGKIFVLFWLFIDNFPIFARLWNWFRNIEFDWQLISGRLCNFSKVKFFKIRRFGRFLISNFIELLTTDNLPYTHSHWQLKRDESRCLIGRKTRRNVRDRRLADLNFRAAFETYSPQSAFHSGSAAHCRYFHWKTFGYCVFVLKYRERLADSGNQHYCTRLIVKRSMKALSCSLQIREGKNNSYGPKLGLGPCKTKKNLRFLSKFNHNIFRWLQANFRTVLGVLVTWWWFITF